MPNHLEHTTLVRKNETQLLTAGVSSDISSTLSGVVFIRTSRTPWISELHHHLEMTVGEPTASIKPSLVSPGRLLTYSCPASGRR